MTWMVSVKGAPTIGPFITEQAARNYADAQRKAHDPDAVVVWWKTSEEIA